MSVTTTRKNPGALKAALDRLEKLAGKEIACGFPAGKENAYPDGTSVVDVAAKNCFGVGVPQRDFMSLARPIVISRTTPIMAKIGSMVNDARAIDGIAALQEAAGQIGAAAIKEAIIALDTPPNSPETIRRKGSSNPLVDTGHMVQSVTYVVRDRKA